MSEYGSLIDDVVNTGPRLAVANIEDDPEKAKRSLDLSEASGVPATTIYGDVENFERQHKAGLASEIVRSNSYISDYLAREPMGSRISNDDYGQLDTASSAINKLHPPARPGHLDVVGSTMSAAIRGFKEGFGEGGVGSYMYDAADKGEFVKENRLFGATVSVITSPVELTLRSLSGIIKGFTDAANAGGEQFALQMGADPANARRIGRELGGLAEKKTNDPVGLHGPPITPEVVAKARETLLKARPWIDAGVEPPVGIDPQIDKAKKEQSRTDLANLDEAFKESEASLTKERNPDIYAAFVRQHTNASIGISAEAVRKLYGDKLPDLSDNILGFVPDLARQLEAAEAFGGDIHIPLADWLAKTDPEVAKALHDDIRVRPGGITVEEGKVLSETRAELKPEFPEGAKPLPEVPLGPVDAIRDSASLRPMFQLDERTIALKRTLAQGEFHEFDLVSETGSKVAELMLSLSEDGKTLSIDNIYGMKGYGPQSLGPSLMRSLLEQIKAEFPTAEKLAGFRVTGAREKAGSVDATGMRELPLREELNDARDLAVARFFDQLLDEVGHFEDFGMGVKAEVRQLKNLDEVILYEIVTAEINRIAPGLEVHAVGEIKYEGRNIHGAYLPHETKPIMLWSLNSERPLHTARHEALHHLRRHGFFSKTEWATLMEGALDNDWMAKYNIERRYKDLPIAQKVEEAIAEGYGAWRRGEKAPSDGIHAIFERIKDLLEGIKRAIRQILGKDPTLEDLFDMADEGKIGSRVPDRGRVSNELARSEGEATPIAERELFSKANAIGMTVDQYKRYMALIEKRRAEDLERQTARVFKAEQKRQSAEWKENKERLRPEVVESINARPDMAADRLLTEGMLFDENIGKIKIAIDAITPEQRAALSRDYVGVEGMHPDDIAGLVGYQSGQALIQALANLTEVKKASGMRTMDFKRRVIEAELERQMEMKYGKLEENVLQEAKDQVLSSTQLDLLHEEVVALAMKAGAELSLTKEQIKAWTEERLHDMKLTDTSVDRLLAAAGKTGKEAEMALLKGKFDEAFRKKQQQYLAVTMANEMKKVEKAQEAFAKTAKRLQPREVKGIEQEYTNFAQELLVKAGLPVRRSIQELQEANAHGYRSLEDFVTQKSADGWEMAVSEDLQLGQVKKLEDMSIGEFLTFKDAIDSLVHIGREVRKIEVAGEKLDFADLKAEILENIRTLPVRNKDKPARLPFRYDAELTRIEEIAKDLDLRQDLGPVFNSVIRPMMEAKGEEYAMIDRLGKELDRIKGADKKWQKRLGDGIPNDFFIDPHDGTLFDLSRQHMINIMLNWGNRSNIEKFTRGYGSPELGRMATKDEARLFEAKIKELIDTNATREDWQYVQNIWGLFETWKKDSDKMYRNLSGVAPKWIEHAPVDTPHGEMAGGYFPVIYDRLRSNIEVVENKAAATKGLFDKDYFRATTGKGYTKERTGYVDRVQFETSIEQVASRMQQMIHDIAYRRAVMDAGKIIYDREIRGAIRKHYGMEYEKQLDPWLKDIANHFNQSEEAISLANSFLRRARMNLMAHALGLNLKVIGSPDVGSFNPFTVMNVLRDKQANIDLAWEMSKEIPHTLRNMDQNYREKLEHTITTKGWSAFQADAVRWAFMPMVKVSQGFRIVTFVTEYKAELAKGFSDVEAAAIADSKVRERHGSSGLPDLPAIMRSNEAMKIATTFYGFFSTTYNWQRQLPGNVRRGELGKGLENFYGAVLIPAAFGALLFNQNKKEDSWFKVIAKALVLQPLSTLIFAREFANYYLEGYPPRSPVESLMVATGAIIADGKKWKENKPIEKPIQHAANVVGLGFGLPLAQIGRTGQFAYDVSKGKQRPKNILEWMRGIVHGEAVAKK